VGLLNVKSSLLDCEIVTIGAPVGKSAGDKIDKHKTQTRSDDDGNKS
jgi:hypothetical protein